MTSPPGAFGDYQLEIYGAGLNGVLPRFPMAFAELEARAEQALPPSVLSYVAGGATTPDSPARSPVGGPGPRLPVGGPGPRLPVGGPGPRLPVGGPGPRLLA